MTPEPNGSRFAVEASRIAAQRDDLWRLAGEMLDTLGLPGDGGKLEQLGPVFVEMYARWAERYRLIGRQARQ